MKEFKREERYIVLKLKHLTEEEIENLYSYNHAAVECVVIESDWKCYEEAWKMVEKEYTEK